MAQMEDLKIAHSLLQHVKARFASDLAVYEEFLELFRSFGRKDITDIPAVVARAHALLHGHPDLIQLFDAFNPLPHAEPIREDPPKRPKRERRRQPAAAAVAVNADCASPMRFLERVKLAGAGIYDRVLALLFHVGSEKTMDANEIYDRAKEIFGSADSDLLRGFIQYLPTERDFLRRRVKKEPTAEHRAPAPKRKAPAAAPAAIPADAAGKKKPRIDDRKTTTNRRASPVVDASKSGEVSAFREAWEFETTYSKLAVTLMRTKKALQELKPKEESPEEVEPSPGHQGRPPRTFEELYPSRECQDVLREMYGGMLGPIREALEDGARTELALKTILRRLRQLEQAAVKIAMERRDPARVEAQMKKLAVERVKVLKDRANGEAARDGRGPCAPPAGVWHDAA